ncbi:MAG: cytochrome c oxidase subunit 3 family protein [Candidatus Margulisbacteria bacterium]|nr:cytochrome c oxidase subunit 3 family protein [Candidatus Margulisiibacteriota bacterium]
MSKQKESLVQHHVAHHFDTAEQEFSTAKLGMWVFLVQELLFFGALFVAFFVFKYLYPEMYVEAHHHLSWKMGALNTIFLITSSFTMVMGVRSAQTNQRRATKNYLFATMLLACSFLVVKYFEYAAKFHHGLLPPHFFFGEGVHQTLPIFFGLYFVMTGLHGIHVLIGIGLIAWLMYRNSRGEFNSEFYTPVEMVGLYWHFVDLVWIFLFPLFYLVG